jgi:hypothetical protein
MPDWRIDNAKHTRGAALHFQKYTHYSEDWDHDHFEACWAMFMEVPSAEILTGGYTTEDNYRWICPQCFQDLKEEMQWKLA